MLPDSQEVTRSYALTLLGHLQQHDFCLFLQFRTNVSKFLQTLLSSWYLYKTSFDDKYLILIDEIINYFKLMYYLMRSRRGLVVKALDSHARGCGFKSCLAKTTGGGR